MAWFRRRVQVMFVVAPQSRSHLRSAVYRDGYLRRRSCRCVIVLQSFCCQSFCCLFVLQMTQTAATKGCVRLFHTAGSLVLYTHTRTHARTHTVVKWTSSMIISFVLYTHIHTCKTSYAACGQHNVPPPPASGDLNSDSELSAWRSAHMSVIWVIILHPYYTKFEVHRPCRSEDTGLADFRPQRVNRPGDLDLWPFQL